MRQRRTVLAAYALIVGFAAACGASNGSKKNDSTPGGSGNAGGGGSGTGAQGTGAMGATSPNGVSVNILPKTANAYVGGTVQFNATVSGASDMAVTWKIEEDTDGSIDDSGLFTAPTTPGTYHVIATSVADAEARDRSTVAVSPVATGEPGVWEQVTPPGMSIDKAFHSGGNFGAQELFVDPANPNVLYLTATYQGMWKSTDYGLTYTKMSADDGPLDRGAAWAIGLDPDPNRDPKTPPVLYSATGYGPMQGFWRSRDDGKTWDHFSMGADNDMGSMSVDPNDKNHVICGMRASKHVLETKDGGETWNDLGEVGHTNSNHMYFVTSNIWLLVSEWGDGTAGTRRTADGGKTWAKVSTCERFHGSNQPYIGSNGLILAPCVDQIMKSTDYGATWEKVADGASSAIVATGTYYYVATGWATQGLWDANPRRADIAGGGVDWADYTTMPEAMSNGPHRATVTFDGKKHIVLSANWLAGVWRYVEP